MSQLEILPKDFAAYLSELDTSYQRGMSRVALFNTVSKPVMNPQQKRQFAGVFYHVRGHFISFMWCLANFCQDAAIKRIILDNMAEELGTDEKFSHEELYGRFAHECGIDVKDEIIHATHHLPFVQQFNREHLAWLANNSVTAQIAAFAAYEHLDNIDYPHLYELAKAMGVSESALTFFRVHLHVEHFGATLDALLPRWQKDSGDIQKGMAFIFSHQLSMWQNLSRQVLGGALSLP